MKKEILNSLNAADGLKKRILKLDFFKKKLDNDGLSDIINEFKHFPNIIKRINLLLAFLHYLNFLFIFQIISDFNNIFV